MAIKTEVFTSQREIIRMLKVTYIDFFTQKSSLPTYPIHDVKGDFYGYHMAQHKLQL